MTLPYAGRKIALLTQHGKETVIGAELGPALGCEVVRVAGFDTDRLGTFTREQARPGTQLEAARRKAQLGAELAAERFGLGSEGSFGPDPYTGLMPWNVEMLCLVDREEGLEVVGLAQGAARSGHVTVRDWDTLADFATRQGFPSHRLVLRPDHEDNPRIVKDLDHWGTLRRAFEATLAQATQGQVFAETDLRAFANPTRMATIGRAAADLGQRLRSACPACEAPGWWPAEPRSGLPCAGCGWPTSQPRGALWRCVRCAHAEERLRPAHERAEPRHCARCNP